MKTSVALLSLLGGALAEGVTESIAPDNSYPDGCSKDFSGSFEVTIAVVKNAKRDLDMIRHQKRSSTCTTDGILVMSLADGTLTDSKDRTGYIASNYQFQFDSPAQAGAIYTSGFSVCGNDSLALGDTTTFYQCKSGSFWNLYDRNWAEQCEAVQIIALPCGTDSSAAASETADGQVVATEVITTTVVQTIGDGQVQAVTTTIPVPICQIGDGQVQGHSTPCASISVAVATTEAASAPAVVPVSQYSDGQIQVTTPATTAVPAATTTAPAATTTAPAATTTAPAAGSSAPAAGTTAPAAGSSAPAAGTTAPAAGGSTPAAGTTTAAAAGTTSAGCGSGSDSECGTTVAVTSYSNSTTFASVTSGTATPAAGTTSAAPPAGSSGTTTSGAARFGAGLTMLIAVVAAAIAL